DDDPREGEVARAAPALPAEGVHAPDGVRVQADARGEGKAAAVRPAERDAPRLSLDEPLRRRDRVAREPEGAGENAGAAAGEKADGPGAVDAVQHLVRH